MCCCFCRKQWMYDASVFRLQSHVALVESLSDFSSLRVSHNEFSQLDFEIALQRRQRQLGIPRRQNAYPLVQDEKAVRSHPAPFSPAQSKHRKQSFRTKFAPSQYSHSTISPDPSIFHSIHASEMQMVGNGLFANSFFAAAVMFPPVTDV